MKKLLLSTIAIASFLFQSCEIEGDSDGSQTQGSGAGVLTGAEWNDLDNWNFWRTLNDSGIYSTKNSYWGFYTQNRISLVLENNSMPVINATVKLLDAQSVVWEAKSDKFGKVELWPSLYDNNNQAVIGDYAIEIGDSLITQNFDFYNGASDTIKIQGSVNPQPINEICFIVDATGSMGDEIRFLRNDLTNIIERTRDHLTGTIRTSAVFYRDSNDDYTSKASDLTEFTAGTANFINKQKAGGGGDYPEAVETGLSIGIRDINWTENATSKLAFLLYDAPPHYRPTELENIRSIIKEAASKGIKVIPIGASGIDKNTEFLSRYFSVASNGTYVFITDDSGVGESHIQASVGDYQVEFLNDLIVRLIEKYGQ